MATELTTFTSKWVLWYFDPRNKEWTLPNYTVLSEIETPQQFWSILTNIPKEAFECGYFFFMKKGIRPIWEVPENANGGSWSKKVLTTDISEIITELMVHCVCETMMSIPGLVGFSTSPKGDHNVIKIWNVSSVQTSTKLLNNKIKCFPITQEIVYTAHKSRR